jgi:putative SOS response-associated peptidase YedK
MACSWWTGRVLTAAELNSKAETVESRPTFAEAFAHRRGVIPANGFYEWTGPKYARQPFWIHRGDGDLLLFAGPIRMEKTTTTAPRQLSPS